MTLIFLLVFLVTVMLIAVCAFQFYRIFLRQQLRFSNQPGDGRGYVRRRCVVQGEALKFCINVSVDTDVTVVNLSTRETVLKATAAGTRVSSTGNHWQGCDWPINLSIDSQQLVPGLYALQIHGPTVYNVPFIVSPERVGDVAIVLPTFTWLAYNEYGGISNYTFAGLPLLSRLLVRAMRAVKMAFYVGETRQIPALPLSFDRPDDVFSEEIGNVLDDTTPSKTNQIVGDAKIVRHLEELFGQVGVYGDTEFETAPQITSAKMLVFGSHSEYWSPEMRGRLRAYIENGGIALFLSGNNMFRQIERHDDYLMVTDQQVSETKIGRLVGAYYSATGFDTTGAYTVCREDHWVFAGLDAERSPIVFGDATASGRETDKVSEYCGDVTVLAMGTNATGPAHMTLRELPSGGCLLSMGSINSSWYVDDPVISRVIANLAKRAGLDTSS